MVITATDPDSSTPSTSQSAARMAAWRNRTGAPSLVTTRSPMAALPGVRPRHSVSKATGYTNSTAKKANSTKMPDAVEPNPPLAAAAPAMATAMRMPAWITVSSSRATKREPRPAVSNCRTTASGVTSLASTCCIPPVR